VERDPEDEPIVAVGLLTQTNVNQLGSSLKKVFPIDETPCFQDLLRAIDAADREHWRAVDRSAEQ
jgi:hypothetical protein